MPSLRKLPLKQLTPSRLWSELDSETRELAARSLYTHPWDSGSMRAEADQAIASTLHFRDVAIRRLPVNKRIDYLTHAVRPDDSLASSLLTALHLAQRSEMLGTFLETLGIPQEDGVIDGDHDLEEPDPQRLDGAVAELSERFPEADVQVYLASLLAMDPDHWGGLADLLRRNRVG